MEHLDLGDVEVTYERTGDGEPIVFIHASAFVPLYRPLIARLGEFSTLWYRRRLAGDGAGGFRPFTLAEDAAIGARLLDHVGLPAAHVVGHSYGALVALQLAVDAPERVTSLALLEPAARAVANTEDVVNAHLAIVATYQRGDRRSAMDQCSRRFVADGIVYVRARRGARSPCRSPHDDGSEVVSWLRVLSGTGPVMSHSSVAGGPCDGWSEAGDRRRRRWARAGRACQWFVNAARRSPSYGQLRVDTPAVEMGCEQD